MNEIYIAGQRLYIQAGRQTSVPTAGKAKLQTTKRPNARPVKRGVTIVLNPTQARILSVAAARKGISQEEVVGLWLAELANARHRPHVLTKHTKRNQDITQPETPSRLPASEPASALSPREVLDFLDQDRTPSVYGRSGEDAVTIAMRLREQAERRGHDE